MAHHHKEKEMAVITVSVCNDFHASPDDQINFTNPTTQDCTVTQVGSTWPFTDASGFVVPAAGKTTYMKPANQLPNATYLYNVSCCPSESQKSVTVP